MKLLCYSFSCGHSLPNYCNHRQLSLSQSSHVKDRTWGNFCGIHPSVVYYIKIGIHAAVNHSGSRQHICQFGREVLKILLPICWFESVLSTYFHINVSWRDFYVIFRNWSNACFKSLQKVSPESSLLPLGMRIQKHIIPAIVLHCIWHLSTRKLCSLCCWWCCCWDKILFVIDLREYLFLFRLLWNSRDDLCLSLLTTAGRTTAKSSAGAATRWRPISQSCPTWCPPAARWLASPTSSPSSGWPWPTWKPSGVSLCLSYVSFSLILDYFLVSFVFSLCMIILAHS